MMIKRRIDEDFKHVWAINWNGLPEDFSDATEIVLTASVYGKKKQLERGIDYVIEGNLIIVDFTPRFATIAGIYNLELKYIKPSDGFIDGERRSAVDIDVVQIVAKSSQVTATGDITSTSEAMTGFQGLSAYEVWLKDNPDSTKEDYYNWLQKPATDAVSLIEDKIDELDTAIQQEEQRELAEGVRLSNEQSRVEAEGLRVSGEVARNTAEGIRVGNESTRIDNEGIRLLAEEDRVLAEEIRVENETLRISAELSRKDAESDREDAEQLRQTNTSTAIQNANEATQSANNAAELANTKAGEANTAAQNADNARSNIIPSVLNNEEVQADVYAQLNARITALEAILTNKIKDRVDVTKEFNVWGKTNLILYGDGTNTKAPDFIGQTYIDTTNGNVYIAVGVSNAGNWKLV